MNAALPILLERNSKQKTEAFIDGIWYTIARNRMSYNEQGKRTSLENLAGVLKSSTRYTRLKQNMKRIVVFCPPEGVACGAFAGALDQACWASRPLDLYPELERIETVGRRAVEWYAHDASPAWGGRGYRVRHGYHSKMPH